RVSYRPEDPGPAETGYSFLFRGNLRPHGALLSRKERHHGREHGRARRPDTTRAPGLPSRRRRVRARLSGRPRRARDVQRRRPPRLPQGAPAADAHRRRGPAPRDREEAVSAVTFALLMTGVLLNAAAQLLLKAGTNAVGAFELSAQNIVPV